MPEVKKFLNADIPLFHDVKYINKGGADPVMFYLNKDGEKIENTPLDKFSREECNNELLKRGFYKKKEKNDEVPDEERTYKTRAELDIDQDKEEL